MFEFNNKTLYGIDSEPVRYTWISYYLFALTSSLIGDTTILISSIRYKAFKLNKTIVIIIQHIAVCDLILSLIDIFPKVVSIVVDRWIFGTSLCHLSFNARYYFNLTSLLLICAMTTSKLLLLNYPLRFGTTSSRRAHVLCLACWGTALIVPAIFMIVDRKDIYFSYRSYECDHGFSSDTWKWLKPLVALLVIFTPNCVVVTTTIKLLVIARRVAHRGRQSLKWQGIMTTVLTATVYCLSVLPYIVYVVGEPLIEVQDKSRSVFFTVYFRVAASFLTLNTISNFYIYGLTVHSFRNFILSKFINSHQLLSTIGTSSQG